MPSATRSKSKMVSQEDSSKEKSPKKSAKTKSSSKESSPSSKKASIASLSSSIASEGEKSANSILDLLKYVEQHENHEDDVVQHAILSLLMSLDKLCTSAKSSTKDNLARNKYRVWLEERMVEFADALVTLIDNEELCLPAIDALLKLLPLMKFKEEEKQWSQVQIETLQKLVFAVFELSKEKQKLVLSEMSPLSTLLATHTDLKHQILAAIARIIKSEVSSEEESESKNEVKKLSADMTIAAKAFLDLINLGPESKSKSGNEVLICSYEGLEYAKSDSGLRFAFSAAWDAFLKHADMSFNVELYKQVVLLVSTRVMPHHRRPLLLTDFLLESYDVGGAVSILALEGVFQLVQHHKLEYPDFYKKLYSLMTTENLLAKYRPRLLYLSNIFMGSSHLPEYLVASFIKRLARISLQLSAEALMSVLPFMGNLIMRHKGLFRMIEGSADASSKDLDTDPFMAEEEDPSKTRAAESFLWELLTLQSHALPQVSKMAKELSTVHKRNMEYNLADVLELSHSDLFETEVKKHVFVNVPLTFKRPLGVKSPENELVSKHFKLK